MGQNETRKAFEAWAQGCGWDISKIGSGEGWDGTYTNTAVRFMWEAWQAARRDEMGKTNDGGPAFPLKTPLLVDHKGMSLRDYFAAKALQGWISNPGPSDETLDEVAQWSYRVADAMLKVRNQQGEQQ